MLHVILIITLWGGGNVVTFTDKETEVQRDGTACARDHTVSECRAKICGSLLAADSNLFNATPVLLASNLLALRPLYALKNNWRSIELLFTWLRSILIHSIINGNKILTKCFLFKNDDSKPITCWQHIIKWEITLFSETKMFSEKSGIVSHFYKSL